MKILKPDDLAPVYRTLDSDGQPLLAVGMMALFPFDRSERAGLLPEATLWTRVAAATADAGSPPLDEGWPKPRAEFLLYGAAYAPGGAPVAQMAVAARLGDVAKQLYVFGDREFGLAGLPSSPRPFTRMPLSPRQAYGGPGNADNPAGKGAAAIEADGCKIRPLPNVESPDALIVSPSDAPAPAGFWPLPSHHRLRARHLGTFDDAWLQQRWPHLPRDTNDAHFLSAPPDQRLAGYLRGDEAFELRGMHPAAGTQSGRLPGLRARCFAHRLRADGQSVFEEAPAQAETVWFLPEDACAIVLYRACFRIDDSDADDVRHLVLDWENAAEAPLPAAHYQQILQAEIAPVADTAAAVDAAQTEAAASAGSNAAAGALAAGAAAAAIAVAAGGKSSDTPAGTPAPAASPEVQAARDELADLEKQVADLMRQQGLDPDATLPVPDASPDVLDVAAIEARIQALDAHTDAVLAERGLTRAQVEQALAQYPDTQHLATFLKTSPATLAREQARLDVLTKQAAAASQHAPGSVLDAALTDTTRLEAQVNDLLRQRGIDPAALPAPAPDAMPVVVDVAAIEARTQAIQAHTQAVLAERGVTQAQVEQALAQYPDTQHLATFLKTSPITLAREQARLDVLTKQAAAASQHAPGSVLDAALTDTTRLEAQVNDLLRQRGIDPAALPAPAPDAMPVVVDAAAIEARTRTIQAHTQAVLAERGLTQAQVEQALAQYPDTQHLATFLKTSPVTLAREQARLDVLTKQAAALQASTATGPQAAAPARADAPSASATAPTPASTPRVSPTAASTGTSASGIAGSARASAGLAAGMSAINGMGGATQAAEGAAAAESGAGAALAAPDAAAAALPALPEPLTREQVIAMHARGESIAGRDIAGLDLSELDLSGADFTQANAAGTSFRNSTLANTRFDQALLQQTDFSGADLSAARLTASSAGQATFAGARMERSDLSQGDFTGAHFAGVPLHGAQMGGAIFDAAQMEGIQATGINAQQASFAQSRLAGADLSNAQLARASFSDAHCARASLAGSHCDDAEFHGADLSGARFDGASLQASRAGAGSRFDDAVFAGAGLQRASWEGAAMPRAQFGNAVLDAADFSRVAAQGAVFAGASAKGAKFAKADLSLADMRGINLIGGSLRKSTLAHTQLQQANLYGVDFEGTAPTRASLAGADIAQTLLQIRPPAA